VQSSVVAVKYFPLSQSQLFLSPDGVLPAAQLSQLVWPAPAEYFPAPHTVHVWVIAL